MEYAKLRVYEDGGLIVFADNTGAVISAEPKGTVRLKPFGATGFSFERITTGDGIGFVNSYDDVLDSAGVAWGANFTATLTALGAFFFIASELLASAVIYDNSVSGLAATNVQSAIDEVNAFEPIYESGSYQTFLESHQSGTTLSRNLNTIAGGLVLVRSNCTINEAIVSISTAAVGSGILAIYKYTGIDTFSLIAQSSVYNTNITNNQILTISANLEKGGIYAMCVHANATVSYNSIGYSSLLNIFGVSSVTSNASSAAFVAINENFVYTGTAPATLTANALHTVSVPFLRFKIA